MTNNDIDALQNICKHLETRMSRKNFGEKYAESTILLIRRIGEIECLHWILNNSRLYFGIDFLLCFPEIWSDFSIEDWKRLSSKISREEKGTNDPFDPSRFSDIIFADYFLEINYSAYLLTSHILTQEQFEILHKHIKNHARILNRKKQIGFDSGMWGGKSFFEVMKIKLIQSGLEETK
jgi:hypothetical protein